MANRSKCFHLGAAKSSAIFSIVISLIAKQLLKDTTCAVLINDFSAFYNDSLFILLSFTSEAKIHNANSTNLKEIFPSLEVVMQFFLAYMQNYFNLYNVVRDYLCSDIHSADTLSNAICLQTDVRGSYHLNFLLSPKISPLFRAASHAHIGPTSRPAWRGTISLRPYNTCSNKYQGNAIQRVALRNYYQNIMFYNFFTHFRPTSSPQYKQLFILFTFQQKVFSFHIP